MIIRSMTATFGKLQQDTLTLEPGLNILQAPNEWGKSTWCAFLVAMLYGLETRTHSTKNVLADKERYAPWSGAPMEGRMDILWQDRAITIQRRTKGRVPLGEFAAFETDSGLPVTELTAANCGQLLLGVERSVFLRAGFVRLADLPVTEDEALRRRLNNLVTTGDETGRGDALAQKLKELKNRCRRGRTGLIPQAQEELTQLRQKQNELDALENRIQKIQQRQSQLEDLLSQLENHRAALEYRAAQADQETVRQALDAENQALAQAAEQEAVCASLPSMQEAEQALRKLEFLRQQWLSAQLEVQLLPDQPQKPEPPEPFRGLTGEQAVEKAAADYWQYQSYSAQRRKRTPLWWLPAVLTLLAGGGVVAAGFWQGYLLLGVGGTLAVVAACLCIAARKRNRALQEKLDALTAPYGSIPPEKWAAGAETYRQAEEAYLAAAGRYRDSSGDLTGRLDALNAQIRALTGGESLDSAITRQAQILQCWQDLADARREAQRAVSHRKALENMAKTAQPPRFQDRLTYPPEETARLTSEALQEQRRLQLQLGQCQGQISGLGDKAALERRIQAAQARIARLDDTYAALTMAQDTLTAATEELQRRFAPQISVRAKELFAQLTGSRYDKLTLGSDLSLQVGAQDEATLRSAQWRSDGTVDQLYLALRLAVAEALTPEAPLILDDALVRFDDDRLAKALDVLRQEAQTRQILLFTCQGREKAICEIR